MELRRRLVLPGVVLGCQLGLPGVVLGRPMGLPCVVLDRQVGLPRLAVVLFHLLQQRERRSNVSLN